jgi:hypothetical protein
MPIWLQHLLVVSLALGCLSVVIWQAVGSMRGRKGRIGSCCSKGCGANETPKKPNERIVFLPAEMLGRRR